jgi:transposase
MEQYTEAFVGIDTAKKKHALAIADPGRDGETRYLGEIDSTPAVVQRMIRKLARRYEKLYFCYEAGPTGYGLYRQVRALGHDCIVVAPSLVPKRPGERVKTNRRAVTLARLLRAGDLTPVWVPDAVHEAVRDLVRARTADRRIFAASANSCCRSCCATGGSTVDASIGPRRICTGWRNKGSITRHSRLFSRTR